MISTSRWICVIAWMALIYYLSSIPAIDIPPGPKVVSILIHFFEFFVLALLLSWAIHGGLRQKVHTSTLVSAFIVAVFYGLLDELHQLYVPGRVTDMVDLTVDALGALVAILSIVSVDVVRKRRNEST